MEGIMLDNNHDLQVTVRRNADGLIEHGLIIGDITYQNQELIVLCEKGEIKSHPIKGVGIGSFLDDETPENLIRNIRTELSQEGMRVNQVGFDANRNLVIDAEY